MANNIIVQQLRSKTLVGDDINGYKNAKMPTINNFKEGKQDRYGVFAINYAKNNETISSINDENEIVAFNYNLNINENDITSLPTQVVDILKTAKSITINNKWLVTHRVIDNDNNTMILHGGFINENSVEYMKVEISSTQFATFTCGNKNFIAEEITLTSDKTTKVDVKSALEEIYDEIKTIKTNAISVSEGDGIKIINGGDNKKIIYSNLSFTTSKYSQEGTEETSEYLELIDTTTRRTIAQIDISSFIIDGMLEDVTYNPSNKSLNFIWKDVKDKETGENKTVNVNIADLVDTYTANETKGLTVQNNKFSVKLNENDNFIGFDENGIIVTKNISNIETELNNHKTNNDIHVTLTDKTNWNATITNLTQHENNINLHLKEGERAAWNKAKSDIDAFLDANAIKDDTINTLKEIQDYISEDVAAAAQMVSNITNVQTTANNAKTLAENAATKSELNNINNIITNNKNNINELYQITQNLDSVDIELNNELSNIKTQIDELNESIKLGNVNYAMNTQVPFVFKSDKDNSNLENIVFSTYGVRGLKGGDDITVSYEVEVDNLYGVDKCYNNSITLTLFPEEIGVNDNTITINGTIGSGCTKLIVNNVMYQPIDNDNPLAPNGYQVFEGEDCSNLGYESKTVIMFDEGIALDLITLEFYYENGRNSLESLIKGIKFDKLDLTEFDISEIKNMCLLCKNCTPSEIEHQGIIFKSAPLSYVGPKRNGADLCFDENGVEDAYYAPFFEYEGKIVIPTQDDWYFNKLLKGVNENQITKDKTLGEPRIILQFNERYHYSNLMGNKYITQDGKYTFTINFKLKEYEYNSTTEIIEDTIGTIDFRLNYCKNYDNNKPLTIKLSKVRINKGNSDCGWYPSIFDNYYNIGSNYTETVVGLPADKRLCYVNLTNAVSAMNLSFNMDSYSSSIAYNKSQINKTPKVNGEENHYIIYNSTANDITITFPNNKKYVLLTGNNITISPNSYAEVNCVIMDDTVNHISINNEYEKGTTNQGKMYIRAIV